MGYINNYKVFKILENSDNSSKIIKKGTELFHATGEGFNIKEIRGGGYDKVLWTTTDSGIAQSYISVSSTVHTSTDNFIKPPRQNSKDVVINSYKNSIGLIFKEVEYIDGRLSSYISPIEFDDYSDVYNNLHDKYYSLLKQIEIYKKEMVNVESDNKSQLLKDISKLNKEAEDVYNKKQKNDPDIKKREYVNNKLQKLGYKPESIRYYGDNDYKLKLRYNEDGEGIILPNSFRMKGKLIILTPKEDLNIFDMRTSDEGDLTDLDYHKIDLFRKIEKEGYDGILINDFAQIESEGNFGHRSIGIFNNSIDKLNVNVIDNVEHPDSKEIERMFKTKNWHSKEYIENKK